METENAGFSTSLDGMETNPDGFCTNKPTMLHGKRPLPGAPLPMDNTLPMMRHLEVPLNHSVVVSKPQGQEFGIAMVDDSSDLPDSNKRYRYSHQGPLAPHFNAGLTSSQHSIPISQSKSGHAWWLQTPSRQKPPLLKELVCRICQKNRSMDPSVQAKSNAPKTLMAYYPSLRQRSALDVSSTMIPSPTVPCHYCERSDFCALCPLEECRHCHYSFCFFCRTRNAHGEWLCVSCCCSRLENTDMQLD